MNTLLILHHSTSAITVIACWWLAHQYARIRPPGRAIAIAFAALGLSVLFTMFARGFGVATGVPVLVSKSILAIALVLMALRRSQQERGAGHVS